MQYATQNIGMNESIDIFGNTLDMTRLIHVVQNSYACPIVNYMLSSSILTWNLLKPLQRWASLAWRGTESGLHEYLLHAIGLVLKLVVYLVEIFHSDTVRNHLERVDLPILDHLEKRLPVEVHRRLAIADEADTAFHQGTNVEVVGLQKLAFRFIEHEKLRTKPTYTPVIPQRPKFLVEVIISFTISLVSVSRPSNISK